MTHIRSRNVCTSERSTNWREIQIEFKYRGTLSIGFVHSHKLQGGEDVYEDTYDALRCRSLPAKEPIISRLFCGK